MAHDDDQGNESSGGISGGDVARLAPPIILGVALIAFALANTEKTEIDFLFTTMEAPLILVLLATAVVGAIIAALLRRHRKNS